MKKVIVGIVVALMMIIPFSSAFALDQTTTSSARTLKQQAAAINKANREAAILKAQKVKADREAMRQEVAKKKADLKLQYERNQGLRDQIKSKHISIKTSLADLRKINDATSKAKIAQVKAVLINLTSSREALNGLRYAGKPYWEKLKVNVKAMNLSEAMSNLNSIAGIKDSRFEQLNKINATLTSVVTILAQK